MLCLKLPFEKKERLNKYLLIENNVVHDFLQVLDQKEGTECCRDCHDKSIDIE